MSNSTGIEDARNQSTHTFFTSLWLNLIIFAAELAAFTLLRVGIKEIYEPRTMDKTKSPPPKLTKRWYAWPLAILQLRTEDVKKAGLDSYFFLRFLRMMIIAFAPIFFFSWFMLLPADSMGETSGQLGLNRFTIGNVGANQQSRYWVHLVCLWLFTIWICYLIKIEMRFFIAQRQKYLVDSEHKSSVHACTLLVSGIPLADMNVNGLITTFSVFGPVEHVWLLHDYGDLPDLYERRVKALHALEAAETMLIAHALKRSSDLTKDNRVNNAKSGGQDRGNTRKDLSGEEDEPDLSGDTAVEVDIEIGKQNAHDVVPRDRRPTRRLPLHYHRISLPFLGKRVDTIEWACDEIVKTTKKLEEERNTFLSIVKRENLEQVGKGDVHLSMRGKYRPLHSAFILFRKQISAHLAYQSVIHTKPYTMSVKSVDVSPKDIVWNNLKLSNYERKIRQFVSTLITIGLILLWSFPAAFIGATSNVSSLCRTYRWLSWVCSLGPTAIGIIEGILPPLFLAILMLLLPIIFRIMGRFEGMLQESRIELSVMTRFFSFQVINSFLVVTLSSGIIASLPGLIKDPTSIARLLATNFPQASNFFLSYTILQGLSGTAMGFLQIGPLILYYAQRMFIGNTPRSVYNVKFALRFAMWGAVFPPVTLIAVISIAYSVISPIINGLAFVTFVLFFLLWRYLLIYQYEEPEGSDTGGLFFPRAIQHVFVGLYIQQLCLAALFFLARNEANQVSAVPEGALTLVLVFVTAVFHMLLNHSYAPLIHTLPVMADFISNGNASKNEKNHDVNPADFYHPAVAEHLGAIWLPDDPKDFTEKEIKRLQKLGLGVEGSCKNATIDIFGHVDVKGPPPDIEEKRSIAYQKSTRES